MEDLWSVYSCLVYSPVVRNNNEPTEATEEVAGGIFDARFSNLDNK